MTLDNAKMLEVLDALIAEIPDADHPYWASMAVRDAVDDEALLASGTASPIYLMWASMQDWYELREGDAAEARESIRQAATEWPVVKDDPAARDRYFDRWTSRVREAFGQPARDVQPDAAVGRLLGQVVDYDPGRGVGFVRADEGGPTYFFRSDEIKIDAHYKTIDVGATVGFQGFVSGAGERYAVTSPRRNDCRSVARPWRNCSATIKRRRAVLVLGGVLRWQPVLAGLPRADPSRIAAPGRAAVTQSTPFAP